MKQLTFIILAAGFLFTACKKNNDVPQQSTAEKISGSWKLIQRTEEDYKPINNLISRQVYTGHRGDSIRFNSDNTINIYSDIDGNHLLDYQVLNEKTIRIESEQWTITKLTDAELNMVSEDIDVAKNERSVVIAIFQKIR
jgi:hypothetical protein